MNTRMIALTGAAVLMLSGPVLAGESTPAEKEATRQLNLRASENAKPDLPQQVAVANAATMPLTAPPTEPVTAAPSGVLSTIIDPPSKVATANVLNASGKTVGVVQKVEVTPEGRPTTVSVGILGTKDQVVVLDASTVSYDAHKNEITATSGLPG
jgi:hypothetical protein